MQHSVTERLATHVATLDALSLPVAVVARAQDCLLDSIGCMLGGSGIAEVRDTVEFVLRLGDASEAAVPGLAGFYPTPLAAHAGAQFANALDYDDTVLGVGHPGAGIVATALAIGQAKDSSGTELLRALIAGYETTVRVGRGMEPSEERASTVRGHTWAVLGPTAVASALMNLTKDQIVNAFGFAAQHALVPYVGKWYERPITPLKANYGWAALGGVLSASMAAEGFKTNRQIFDGENGFWRMASSDQWDPGRALAGIGSEYVILDVEFKPFAACRYTHSALDALEQIIERHAPDVSAIRSVVIRAGNRIKLFTDYEPRTLLDAQFSLPFASASLLLGRPLTSFDPSDRELAELAHRVQLEADPDLEPKSRLSRLPTHVEIELQSGERLSEHSEVALGDPKRPIGPERLRQKFFDLAIPVLGADRSEQLVGRVNGLLELRSTRELADLFAVRDTVQDKTSCPDVSRGAGSSRGLGQCQRTGVHQ